MSDGIHGSTSTHGPRSWWSAIKQASQPKKNPLEDNDCSYSTVVSTNTSYSSSTDDEFQPLRGRPWTWSRFWNSHFMQGFTGRATFRATYDRMRGHLAGRTGPMLVNAGDRDPHANAWELFGIACSAVLGFLPNIALALGAVGKGAGDRLASGGPITLDDLERVRSQEKESAGTVTSGEQWQTVGFSLAAQELCRPPSKQSSLSNDDDAQPQSAPKRESLTDLLDKATAVDESGEPVEARSKGLRMFKALQKFVFTAERNRYETEEGNELEFALALNLWMERHSSESHKDYGLSRQDAWKELQDMAVRYRPHPTILLQLTGCDTAKKSLQSLCERGESAFLERPAAASESVRGMRDRVNKWFRVETEKYLRRDDAAATHSTRANTDSSDSSR